MGPGVRRIIIEKAQRVSELRESQLRLEAQIGADEKTIAALQHRMKLNADGLEEVERELLGLLGVAVVGGEE